MLTLFAVPKPFKGHVAVVQRNALTSWARLPDCRIVLLGDDEGTAEAAEEFGAEHVVEIARNEFGTPRLDDVFARAAALAEDGLCYVNADVVLLDELVDAVRRLEGWGRPYLLVGQCWNVDLIDSSVFESERWDDEIRAIVSRQGSLRGIDFLDYFAFPRDLFRGLPPFALGRAAFDNWLLWEARRLGAAVVDGTDVVTAVHQTHDYAHLPGGAATAYGGHEARRNLELAGGRRRMYMTLDATHRLTPAGPRRQLGSIGRLRYRWHAAKVRLASLARRQTLA